MQQLLEAAGAEEKAKRLAKKLHEECYKDVQSLLPVMEDEQEFKHLTDKFMPMRVTFFFACSIGHLAWLSGTHGPDKGLSCSPLKPSAEGVAPGSDSGNR